MWELKEFIYSLSQFDIRELCEMNEMNEKTHDELYEFVQIEIYSEEILNEILEQYTLEEYFFPWRFYPMEDLDL